MLWLLWIGLSFQGADRVQADQLYRAGEYEQAARIYFDLLRANPQDEGLIAITGQAMVDAGHARQALPLLKRAASTKPDDRRRQRYLGRALVESNQMIEAEAVLGELTRAEPKDATAWFYYGALRYQNGYYPASLEIFDRVLSLPPLPEEAGIRKLAQVYRVSSLAQLGRGEEAEPAVRALLATPDLANNLELLLTHAQILYENGRWEAALQEASKATRVNDANPQAHAWRARILGKLGRVKEAESEAKQALLRDPNHTLAHTILLDIYRRSGRPEDAAREAEWLRQAENRKTQ